MLSLSENRNVDDEGLEHLPDLPQLRVLNLSSVSLTNAGMESLRSESIQGLSIITAVFKEGTDVFLARQMLGEKLAARWAGLDSPGQR